MLIKSGVQGINYYLNEETEKFRYNPYRRKNRQIAEESYQSNKILDFPLHVIIETSSLCQLKCSFCNREKMKRKKMNMDLDVFKKVVDECAENGVYSLSLYCLGEPFLNPHLREMIIYAKGKGIPYVDVSTNAQLDMSSVAGTGLDEIIISMDKEEKDYEKLRKGAKYDILYGNLVGLDSAKWRGKSAKPLVRLQTIRFSGDENYDFNAFAQKWLDTGLVDVVYIKNLEVFSHTLGDKNLNKAQINERLERRVPCKQLYFVLTVNADGDICYCCHDPEGKSIIGNIKDKTLSTVWVQISDMRDRHRNGEYTQLCSKCVDYSW